MDDLPYVAVVVKAGDPSVKIMSEPCLTELEALRDLFDGLGKQVGHKLKAEGECGIVNVTFDCVLIRCARCGRCVGIDWVHVWTGENEEDVGRLGCWSRSGAANVIQLVMEMKLKSPRLTIEICFRSAARSL